MQTVLVLVLLRDKVCIRDLDLDGWSYGSRAVTRDRWPVALNTLRSVMNKRYRSVFNGHPLTTLTDNWSLSEPIGPSGCFVCRFSSWVKKRRSVAPRFFYRWNMYRVPACRPNVSRVEWLRYGLHYHWQHRACCPSLAMFHLTMPVRRYGI